MFIYLQFLLAFILLVVLTRWLTRKTDPSFNTLRVTLALGAKVLMGCLYGYIFLEFYQGDDTWMFNAESMVEMQKLVDRPLDFFEDLNIFRLVTEYGWEQGLREFRNKLEQAMILKPLAFFNLYSGGNYYLNIIAFSGISFWGHYWLYQLIKQNRPESSNWLYPVVFLYPPMLFWLSGIRPDGILFFFFSLLLFQFDAWLRTQKKSRLLLGAVAISGMLVIRSSFAMIIIPGLVAWWLVHQKNMPVRRTFALAYGLFMVVFFASGLVGGALDLPQAVVNKQQEFFALDGKTRLPLDTLTTHPVSFWQVFPQATANTTLRPYPWEAKGALQYLAIAQNYFLICLFLLVVIRRYPGRSMVVGRPIFAVFFTFCVIAYLSIGYTVPFPGAIIRYKVIPETCLLILFLFAAGGKELSNYKYFNVYKIRGK